MSSLGALTLDERRDLIREGIEGIIQSVDSTALVGIKIYSLDEGVDLYERNGAARFVPASSLKLFTAAAALECLGKEDRFETRVMTDGTASKGVLEGNCYLVGSGDPSLTGLDLVELIDGMGDLVRIEGDLVLDLSCFEDGPKGPGWMWDEEPAFWCVPMNPLNMEHNFVDGVAILQPEKLTAAIFKGILERKGIELDGELRVGEVPEGAVVLATHASEPISELIKVPLKKSDNLYANCLFKRLGPSWEKGRERVEAFLLENVGLNPEEMVIIDGSGLSRYNLVSPAQMIEFLKKMRSNREFKGALPIGGKDGTLKNRMGTIPGKVRAKTGAMTGVSSLCGYIMTDLGEELAVAIFVNGYVKEGREIKKKLEDRICQMLVNMQD